MYRTIILAAVVVIILVVAAIYLASPFIGQTTATTSTTTSTVPTTTTIPPAVDCGGGLSCMSLQQAVQLAETSTGTYTAEEAMNQTQVQALLNQYNGDGNLAQNVSRAWYVHYAPLSSTGVTVFQYTFQSGQPGTIQALYTQGVNMMGQTSSNGTKTVQTNQMLDGMTYSIGRTLGATLFAGYRGNQVTIMAVYDTAANETLIISTADQYLPT